MLCIFTRFSDCLEKPYPAFKPQRILMFFSVHFNHLIFIVYVWRFLCFICPHQDKYFRLCTDWTPDTIQLSQKLYTFLIVAGRLNYALTVRFLHVTATVIKSQNVLLKLLRFARFGRYSCGVGKAG